MHCPIDVDPTGCKWVYQTKLKSDRCLDKYKAWFFAKGHTQIEGIDYVETVSLFIKSKAIKIVLSLAFSLGWDLKQLNINNAFLNGALEETIYMKQPIGFEDKTYLDQVCKLTKALFGLK